MPKLSKPQRQQVRELWVELTGSDICPLCVVDPVEVVDHDHSTGLVLGMLCGGCNIRRGSKTVAEVERMIVWLNRVLDYMRGAEAFQLVLNEQDLHLYEWPKRERKASVENKPFVYTTAFLRDGLRHFYNDYFTEWIANGWHADQEMMDEILDDAEWLCCLTEDPIDYELYTLVHDAYKVLVNDT